MTETSQAPEPRQFQEAYAQLEKAVADRTRELAAVHAIAQVASRSLDLRQMLGDVLDKTLELVDVESGGVYLLDEKTGRLWLTSHRGHSPDLVAAIDGLRLGEGFSGRVAQTGQPLLVRDISTDERLTRQRVQQEGYQALASVPLTAKDQVLGTLYVITRGQRGFSQQEIRLLTAIGDQIGIAVENTRLFQAEQRRAEQFRLINEVGQRITSILAVDELLCQLVELVRDTLGYRRVSIGLIEGDELVFRAAVGPGWPAHMRLPVNGPGVTPWVARTGEPLLVPDVTQEPRFIQTGGPWASRSELAVPLKTKDAILGVLNIESDRENAFDQGDVVVLQSLANQAATAIQNARLFAAEQRLAGQFRLISEVGHQIIEILEVDRLLDEIARQVSEILGYYLVGIGLIEGDWVVMTTGVGPYWEQGDREPLRLRMARDGIVGWVAHTGEPFLAPDVAREPRYYAVPEIPDTQSELAVPMRTKQGVLGVLDVQSTHLAAFDQMDIVVLQALADQAAVAIEKARSLEAERRRIDELEALRTTMADITAELELSTLLQAIVERAAGLLDATGGELGLYDEQTQQLRIVVSHNLGRDYVGTRHSLGEGAMGRVAQTGEALIIDDYQAWAGGLEQYSHIRATMAAPLTVGGRLVGVFTTVSTDPHRRFTADNLHLLNLFAQQAAIAIENARLYQQAQRVAALEERQRLARDLHDSVTQAIYSVTLYGEAAAGQLAQGDVDTALEHLRDLQTTAQEALAEMRMLIHELRPPILEEEGLVAALQARLLAVEGRVGLRTDFRLHSEGVPALEDRLPPEVEDGLYRIAQEALNNALKHARAQTVRVKLYLEEGRVALEVVDDGVGFDPQLARTKGGLGLAAMRERAESLGGQLTLETRPGGGVCVRADVPTDQHTL